MACNLFSLCLTNARGITAPLQLSDLSNLLGSHLKLIAITETHLDQTIPNNLITAQNDWSVFRRDRNRYGGGVALLTKFPSKLRKDLHSPGGEDVWIEFTTEGKRVIVGAIYRPPSQSSDDLTAFMSTFENSIQKALNSCNIICILGDFNAKSNQWLTNGETDKAGTLLFNLLESHNLKQLVNEVTRPPGGQGLPSSTGQGSLLDLIITNRPDLFEAPMTHPPLGSSDHYCVRCVVNLKQELPKQTRTRLLWNLKKADIPAFLHDLRNQDWPSAIAPMNIDEQWTKWQTLFLNSALKHIPCKKIKHISHKPPWLSDSLLAECKLKSRLFHLSKMQPTEENSKKYRAQRNRVTALIRRAKKDFASSFDDICGRQTGSNLWSLMKKLRKKSNNDNLPDLLTPNNTLATTDKDKANTLNNFFLSQSSTDSPSDPIYKLCPPPLPTSARLCEIQVSPAEVYSALSSLKEKKAAGIDGLPNSLLKVAAPAICFSLAALFNNSLLAGKLPRDWKRANVRAIYKRGPKHLPDNYRPISLLSSVTKVLESLVNKSLSNFLSANNLISPFQSGFRRGDSAPLQLFRLTTELFAAVDSRAVAAAVFYDFKKAFDSVWHRALIGKLFSAGVSGSALEWLSDFITDRTQHVQVGDSLSNPGSPTAGVPQGSPLSPTLFILFINSVTSSTSCPTNCFADDTCTITPGLPFITAQQKIQSDVTALATWARDHKLIIHPEKTVCMLFHHPRHHPPDLNIFLNNHAITQVHQHKHLGVILSSTLSWSPHVEHLISRSSAMLGLLRHLLSYFHFSSRCLLKVYLCYIRPLLEYGCSSFVGLSVRSARQLEAVQQKALSICSVDSDCIPSLSERRSSVSLRLFFSILDDNVPDHLSGFCHWPFVHTATSRTLRNSSAIRLPRPRTSLFLSSPLYLAASAYNSSISI